MLKLMPASSKPASSNARREKRKGVHFDVDVKEEIPAVHLSTSDYVRQSGLTWEALSIALQCDDHPTDHEGLMEELLQLCCWDDDEPVYHEPNEEDSDDDEWMAAVKNGFHKHNGNAPTTAFGQHGPKLPVTAASASSSGSIELKVAPSVSDLRFNSFLRLDSHCFTADKKKPVARFIPSRSASCSQDSSSSDTSGFQDGNDFDLEQAFKGIIEDDNSNGICDKPEASDAGGKEQQNSENFWNDVEF